MIDSTGAEAAGSPLSAKPSHPSDGPIPSVDWWTTSRCNLACDFCYGPVPGADPVARRDQILRALVDSSAHAVTLCGGEPLLLKKISQYGADLIKSGKTVVLNTNGQLLIKRLNRKVPKALRVRLRDFTIVGISVDGPTQEIHRAMRGMKADLHEALAAARRVRYHPGVKLKIATVVSEVNRDSLPELAAVVGKLKPDVWRLYQYSSRGDQNSGRSRHRLSEGEFLLLAKNAEDLAGEVRTVASTEAKTMGCLIVDPAGNVLQPSDTGYIRHGNLLERPLDHIWEEIQASFKKQVAENKGWLSGGDS